ncbi:carboxylating nicotinate-nucleotide diphosphorylase [Bdellovibrio reynosensis]|uniref:nicotinate-nucleotide diphosphorylase (carboxylating) n=1 Tax=Bdellovibrio reynosensis TaxID=2835041 RepID=A0ABY4C8V1_9BACT|nr:carboxylating nicotinate-nucleotide diphosphorylase [Bdellovibrio reynosensis]UOF01417.1 carboxylating nicotinate-nucleotide diphosphorylase [Bdellovibrio reynosensis]
MTLLELIRAAIKEDMPQGDVTTESLALKPRIGRAKLKAKEDIVLSGASAFEQSMQALEPNVRIKWHFEEGDEILKNQIICTIEGDLVQVLKAERVALNFLGHLSGIATHTRRFVKKVAGTKTKILDTRKTTPGFRELEKRAVVHGGGMNHRMNLSDAIMIKDNHISVMGGIKNAVNRVREHSQLHIEVEARTLEEIKEAVDMKVHRILLDNMDNEMLKKALSMIPSEIETEASGNMNLERIQSVAEIGVNYISVGALTHSAPCADVSLVFNWED